MKKSICVVGAGRWGRNHIRTLFDLNALGAVVDKNKNTLKAISKKFPNCELFSALDDNVIESRLDMYLPARLNNDDSFFCFVFSFGSHRNLIFNRC